MKTVFAVSIASLFLCPALHTQSAATPNGGSSNSLFNLKFDAGAIVSLKPAQSPSDTQFISPGRRLGDVIIRYRVATNDWQSVNTAALDNTRTRSSGSPAGEQGATYRIINGSTPALVVQSGFTQQRGAVLWTITLQNAGDHPLEIGDLALPLPVNRSSAPTNGTVILKHSFISGHGSFLFWMRSPREVESSRSSTGLDGATSRGEDSTPPFLTLVPTGDTQLEYWENTGGRGGGGRGGRGGGGYNVFVHSAATGDGEAASTLRSATEDGSQVRKWRQPHTSLTLAPWNNSSDDNPLKLGGYSTGRAPKGRRGDTKSYSFKLRWADSYDGVRQILVDEGGIDTQVVPGMTVPSDLFAEIALRTKQKINAVEAEFPDATRIKSLGTKGDYHLYQVRFSRLGENRLTVRYANNRHLYLEFFSTEPLETLIKKRAAFLAHSQHRDPAKWYDGLITDWNMRDEKLISPDDYAPIPRARYYAVTCDDPGLGKPAFLAAKNAEFPVPSEVEALDYYIGHFVWGGLQRTTNETYPYAIYGIPDWRTNRDSKDPGRNGQLHIWREYDYPHVIQMYFAMYRLAKNHPEIKMALSAQEYLRRAYGTANAFFTVPHEVWSGWSPYGTGFYNEVVIVNLIAALDDAGMKAEATTLRGFWERKVRSFVSGRQDLFRSEYAFDSTGFESTHALAKYAMLHPDLPGISRSDAKEFMDNQIAANLFCRGWVEPAYYYLGSDYRGGAGSAYVLTYMSQMGGWGVLDYALNFATNPPPYLRLGYASYLSAWALVNSGTPESNYGYWYPGKANDGAAGGGFEPSANGRMWLVPSVTSGRGSWFFASEIDLGYCGALRTAATILADDPIFGRFCFGGDWRSPRGVMGAVPQGERFEPTPRGKKDGLIEIVPKDGLRRRFHTMLNNGQIHFVSDADRFPSDQPIVLKEDLSEMRFHLESDNPAPHVAQIHFSAPAGTYTVSDQRGVIAEVQLAGNGNEAVLDLPMNGGIKPNAFTITRRIPGHSQE